MGIVQVSRSLGLTEKNKPNGKHEMKVSKILLIKNVSKNLTPGETL